MAKTRCRNEGASTHGTMMYWTHATLCCTQKCSAAMAYIVPSVVGAFPFL